jgi:hypothetical protein
MKRIRFRLGPANLIPDDGNEGFASAALPVAGSSPKKPYKPPKVIEYGNVARLTAGTNGSHFDPGHDTGTKLGVG